jgi:type VII secretion integral membrane protein EccD
MSSSGTDLCRVTVVGPSRRVDIALPGYVSFADLFPAVARYAGLDGPDAVGERGGWVLQRLGQEPFSPAMTPLQAGIRDGEMIYLRPHRAQLPQLAFDDVADVIATGLRDRPGRWAPGDARRVALGAGAVALAAGAIFILRSGPPWAVPAAVAAAVAVGLLLAATAVARGFGDSRAGALLGMAGVPYAFLGGLLVAAGSASLTQLGAVHVLPAFAAAALVAVIAAAASGEVSLFFGLAVAALLGLIGAWLAYAFGIGFAGGATAVTVLVLSLAPLIPAVSFKMARMELPEVPRHADDLRRDTLAVDGSAVLDKTVSADRFVTGSAAGLGLVAAVAEVALAMSHGWLGPLTCIVLACSLLLRSRLFQGIGQRLWLMIPALGGLILLAAGLAHGATQARQLTTAIAPLIGGAALVVCVGMWLANRRPSPFWGRAGDIVDTMLVVALWPLMLGVVGVLGFVRGLG